MLTKWVPLLLALLSLVLPPSIFPSTYPINSLMLSSSHCLKENVYALPSMELTFYQLDCSICDSNVEANVIPGLSWGIMTKLPFNGKTDRNTEEKWVTETLQLYYVAPHAKEWTLHYMNLVGKELSNGKHLTNKSKNKNKQKSPNAFVPYADKHPYLLFSFNKHLAIMIVQQRNSAPLKAAAVTCFCKAGVWVFS